MAEAEVGDGCYEATRWWRSRSSVMAVAQAAMVFRDPGEGVGARLVDEDVDGRMEREGG